MFKIRKMDEIDQLIDPHFILEGILPENTFCLLHGPPGLGKSLLATAWAYSLAYGIPWYGLKTLKCNVLNVLTEGHDGDIKKRQKAWKIVNKKRGNSDNYAWLQDPINLYTQDTLEEFLKYLKKIPKELRYKFLILDTMNRCSAGADENSPRDMGRIIESVFAIKDVLKCVILLVHHPRKNDQGVERGHSSLRGAVDVSLSLQGVPTDPHCLLVCDKNKGGRLFEIPMLREEIQVGKGTSAIIKPYKGIVDFNDLRPTEPTGFFQLAELFKSHTTLTIDEMVQLTNKSRSQIYKDVNKLKRINIIRSVGKAEYQLVDSNSTVQTTTVRRDDNFSINQETGEIN